MSSKNYDRQKVTNIEISVHLTKEQYEKKYLFHRLKERFLHSQDLSLETITPEGHENIYIPMDILTPTQLDGLNYEDEQALRMHGAQLCFQACNQLKLPLTTAITSLVIFHRFFTKNSFVDFDYREISMASLYLAGKVEETMRNTWFIAGAFSTVFQKQKQTPLDIIIKQEKLILKELGFELFRVSDHPHKFIESFYHFLKVDKQVAQKAWYYLNDSYMTDLCVHFPPQVIAAGALYLAMRVSNHPMPTQPWWILLEATFQQIEQVAATIYNIYEFEKMDFRKARRILQKANRVAYVIQHSEIYGIPEAVERPLDFKKQIATLPQQLQVDNQQSKTEKIEAQKSPVKDKKSLKKKSKSKEKKSKDKKNKSEKKKNKSKEKKKEKKEKKKKSRSRSKSNEKKQSKKEKKKKDKGKSKDKSKEKQKEKEKEKDKEKQKKEQEQDKKTIQKEENKVKELESVQQDKGMIKSNMEIEEKNDHEHNNNQQQQINKGNDSIIDNNVGDCRKTEQTEKEHQMKTSVNQDEVQSEENNEKILQQPLQSKQDFITKMKALLKTQQQQKPEIQPNQKESAEDQDSEEDHQLNELKLKILAQKKRNEQ